MHELSYKSPGQQGHRLIRLCCHRKQSPRPHAPRHNPTPHGTQSREAHVSVFGMRLPSQRSVGTGRAGIARLKFPDSPESALHRLNAGRESARAPSIRHQRNPSPSSSIPPSPRTAREPLSIPPATAHPGLEKQSDKLYPNLHLRRR